MFTKKIKLQKPHEVTINDCLLAYQMGYMPVIENGQVGEFRKPNWIFRRLEKCILNL